MTLKDEREIKDVNAVGQRLPDLSYHENLKTLNVDLKYEYFVDLPQNMYKFQLCESTELKYKIRINIYDQRYSLEEILKLTSNY